MNLNYKLYKLIFLTVLLFCLFSCSNNPTNTDTEVYECSVADYAALHNLLSNKNENKTYTIRITDKDPTDLFSIYTENVLNIILDLSNCTKMTELTSFPNDRSIKKIILPNTIKTIQEGVLNDYNAQRLESVEINNNYYQSQDGIVFTADKKSIIAYPASRFATIYEIPKSVEKIATKAFYYTNLVTIKFTRAVTIEQSAFRGDYLKYGFFNGTADECYAFLDKIEDSTIQLLDYTLSDGTLYKFTGKIKIDVMIHMDIRIHGYHASITGIDSICLYYYDPELDKNILIKEFSIDSAINSRSMEFRTQLIIGNNQFIVTTKKDDTETQIYQTKREITPDTYKYTNTIIFPVEIGNSLELETEII